MVNCVKIRIQCLSNYKHVKKWKMRFSRAKYHTCHIDTVACWCVILLSSYPWKPISSNWGMIFVLWFCHLVIDLNLLSIPFLNGVLLHVFPTINCTCSVEMRSCRNPKHLIFFKHPLLSGRILGYIVDFRLP